MTQSATSNATPLPSPASQHPAVRNYMLFCLSALFLSVVCLAERGFEWWCLVPATIGCLALLTHWSHGPPLVLASLAGLFGMAGPRSRGVHTGWHSLEAPTLMDLVLCISVLAYVLGQYRLLSLLRNIFPLDPRQRSSDTAHRRAADLVTGREMALLGLALLLWPGLALMVWERMNESALPSALDRPGPPLLGMPNELWHLVWLVWIGLAMLAVAGTFAGYLRWTTATPEESLLYLQDQCWRRTRREQGSLNRWLTWARRRAQRKKESS